MASSEFSDCPNEILLQIFWLLVDAVSTLKCRQLNTRCRNLIDSSSTLQYAIKLDAWDYEDVPTSSSPLAITDRLTKLDEHIRSWSRLDSPQTHHLNEVPHFDAYNLSQGTLLCLNRNLPNTFNCISFPSRLRDKPEHMRPLPHAFPFPILEFAFDLSQDLLVVLELWVFLYRRVPALNC